MASLEETFPASYKGAPWLVTKTITTGGGKTVVHSYPNSNRQKVEYLGLKPRALTLEGTISSANYIQNRDNLLDAFEEGGVGLLVHPFFGNLENMECLTFNLVEDFTEFGEAKITANFTVSDNVAVPVGTKNNASFISGKNQAVQKSMNSDVAKGFDVGSSASLFEKATQTMNAMFDKIDESTRIVSQAADAADQFSSLINDFATNINDLARKPQEFADSIENIMQNINGLYAVVDGFSLTGNQSVTTAQAQSIQSTKTLAVYSAMFDFGDDTIPAPNTTAERIRSNLNNCIMKQQIQLSALGYAYLNSSQIQYSTVGEIDEIADMIEDQYQKILVNNDCIHSLADMTFENIDFDQSSLLAVQDLRDATQSFFDDVKLTTNRVIQVETTEMSASLLAFQYYGNVELEEDIIELNADQNVSFFSGEVNILST